MVVINKSKEIEYSTERYVILYLTLTGIRNSGMVLISQKYQQERGWEHNRKGNCNRFQKLCMQERSLH